MTIQWIRAAFAAALVAAGSAAVAAPQIRFDTVSLDFGKVASGQPIDVRFGFRNAGDEELVIMAIRPGCGCTKAEAKATRLAPGEASVIETVFNSTGFSGVISKGISVASNDPEIPTAYLTIRGEVIPLAMVRPTMQNFGTLKVGASSRHTFTVVPTDPKTFAIKKVEAQGTHVTAPTYKRVATPGGDAWEVSYTVRANATPGRVMEKIVITTNTDDALTLTTTVYGNVTQ